MSNRRYDRMIQAIKADQEAQRYIGVLDPGLCSGEFEYDVEPVDGMVGKVHCAIGAMLWFAGVVASEDGISNRRFLDFYGFQSEEEPWAIINMNDNDLSTDVAPTHAERAEQMIERLSDPASMDEVIERLVAIKF